MCRLRLSASFRLGLAIVALLCVPAPGILAQPTLFAKSVVPSPEQARAEAQREQAQRAPKPTPEQIGDILVARRQYVAAIAAYREGATDTAVYWNKLGIAYHHLFAITEAKRDYEKALHLNPRYAEAMNNLGTIFYAQKDYRQAEHMYRKALKLTPDSAVLYSNLGTALIARRKYKKGAEAYQRAFGLDPKVFDPNYGGKVEENTPAYARGKLNFYMAETYAMAGMKDQALLYLRRALAEGFDDKKKLMEDKELAVLRETPEFHLLMASVRIE